MALDPGGAEGAAGYKAPKRKKPKPQERATPVARRSAESPGSSSRVSKPRSINRFSNIHVNAGINWKKVDPHIIRKLDRLGKMTGKTITLTSGFRTNEEQKRLYNTLAPQGGVVAVPGTSPHEFGHAVDALVGGRAVGDVFTPEELASVGLKSLAAINDAVHVERLRGGYTTAPVQGSPVGGSVGGSPATVVHADDPYDYEDLRVVPAQGGSRAPADIGELAQPMQPYGEMSVWDDPRTKRAEAWSSLAALPGASPETQALASLAQAAVPEITQRTPAKHSTKELERKVLGY